MIINDGAKVASIDQRYQESCRILQGSTENSSEKTDSSAFSKTEIDRNDYVGKLLFETFPEFQSLKVGKGIEMERNFLPIENFLQALAAQKAVVRQLVELAGFSNLFTEKTSNDKK